MFTLDTNVVIYYLKDDAKVLSVLREILRSRQKVYVSSVTEIELFSYSLLTESELAQIEEILDSVTLIALDSRIARIAGYIRRNFNLSLPDSAIAATALFTGSSLVTRDWKDFQKVPNLAIREF